jgi:NadR type nicotinamide-nucleotide adenylyltransferase
MEEGTFATMKRIAITGPESTGKSHLAELLALHFKSEWVPEFAREYLQLHGPSYSRENVETIALEQLKREQKAVSAAPGFVFYDTDLLVCLIWMEHVFGSAPEWLRKEVDASNFDHTFLMNIDLRWQPDPLREHPHQRDYLFSKYQQELTRMGRSYTIISGIGEMRKSKAIEKLNLIFGEIVL